MLNLGTLSPRSQHSSFPHATDELLLASAPHKYCWGLALLQWMPTPKILRLQIPQHVAKEQPFASMSTSSTSSGRLKRERSGKTRDEREETNRESREAILPISFPLLKIKTINKNISQKPQKGTSLVCVGGREGVLWDSIFHHSVSEQIKTLIRTT